MSDEPEHPENSEVIADIRSVLDELEAEIADISDMAIRVFRQGIADGVDRDGLIIFFVTSLVTSCSIPTAVASHVLSGIALEMVLCNAELHDVEEKVAPCWTAVTEQIGEWRSLRSMEQRMHMEDFIEALGGGQGEPASAPQPPADQ